MDRKAVQRRWLSVALQILVLGWGGAVAAAVPVEVKVVVFSSGAGPDAVSFVYSSPVRGKKARREMEAQARHDFQRLAADFHQPKAAVRISTISSPVQAPPTTSAEGKLFGLVNRAAGWLAIGPFLQLFRRYGHLSLTYFVQPPFRFRGPRGPFTDPTLSLTLDVEGSAYTYDARIRHAPGIDTRALPEFEPSAGGMAGRRGVAFLLVALMALAAGLAVYALLQYWLQRRTSE